jgi:DNA-binding IclR family transcriptional regulator
MLAWLDDRSLAQLYGDRLGSRTPRTITSLDALRTDLGQVRSRHGIAYEREELSQGTVAVAVAVRGTGRAAGALQLAGDPLRVSLERLTPYVQEAGRKVSRALFPGPTTRHRSRTVDVPAASPWPPGALDQLVQGIGGDYWL